MNFVSTLTAPDEQTEPAYWFVFSGYRLLVSVEPGPASVPCLRDLSELGLTAVRHQYLGYIDGEKPVHCYSAEISEESQLPAGLKSYGLRSLYGLLDEEFFWLAARAVQIVDWDRTTQFCGRCGATTETIPHDRAKKCPQCGLSQYPRLAPAIIVLVQRLTREDNFLLLARNQRFPPGLYSVVAGFVEPGETLEMCVRREIKEEVGIEVKNIRYFGSQPWPFPHSLMIAFTAEHAGGRIEVDQEEITEARWFTADNLPQVPPPLSISRQLIDWFVAQQRSA